MRKKVLILTADAGFGHRVAANSIAAALTERYGDRCDALVINPMDDDRAPALLRRAQSDYDRIARESPDLYRLSYQASDGMVSISLLEQALITMLYSTLRDLLTAQQPDAIITTYPLYQAPLAAVFALKNHYVPLLTVITDLVTVHGVWFNDEVDLCLAPTEAVRARAIESGLPPERIEVCGLPVSPALARTVDKAALRAALGWPTDRFVALLQGSKRVTRLEPVADILNHSGLPLALALVSGGDDALLARWQTADWHLPAYVYGFVHNMAQFMQAADLIVCKAGGLIVSEALAAGLPLVIVEAIPGQETGNADLVVEGGAGEFPPDPAAALATICHWLDRDATLLAEHAGRARRLGRPQACYRVADLAWLAAQREPQRREHRLLGYVPFLRRLLNEVGAKRPD